MIHTSNKLSATEAETVVQEIHAAQREAAQAIDDRAADPLVDAALLEVAKARKQLETAQAAEAAISAKYTERVKLAEDTERALRALLLTQWPDYSIKSISRATITTRRSLAVKPNVHPIAVVSTLQNLLGDAAAGKVITSVGVNDKLLMPLWDLHGDELSAVLQIDERRSLTIRKPTEE